MRHLYEITGELQAVLSCADEFDPEDLSQQIEALELEMDDKLLNCWRAYRNYEAELVAYDSEIDRLKGAKKQIEARAEWLKGYVGACIGKGNSWKSADSIAAFSWRTCPASVEIVDEEAVPLQYVKAVYAPNKTLIKQDLQNGAKIAGCKLITDKINLQVK